MPSNLEPLLPDLRVARIEQALRIRNPALPPDASFFTYYQAPEETETGIVPAQAAFSIVVRNPRHPQFDKIFTGRYPFTAWRELDRDARHESTATADPAYRFFAEMVPQLITWYTNTLELN